MSKSHASVAYRSRLQKEKHPEDYCTVKGCLWRVKHLHGPDTPCRKHNRHDAGCPAKPMEVRYAGVCTCKGEQHTNTRS